VDINKQKKYSVLLLYAFRLNYPACTILCSVISGLSVYGLFFVFIS